MAVSLSGEETIAEMPGPSIRGAGRTCPTIAGEVSIESLLAPEREVIITPRHAVGLQASPTTCPAIGPSTSRFIRRGRHGLRIVQASPAPLITGLGVGRRLTITATTTAFRLCLGVGHERMRHGDAGSATLGMAVAFDATKMRVPTPVTTAAVGGRLSAEI